MQGRNTGFKKILDALEANGSPKPEFETDEAHSYFISRFFIHEGFAEHTQANEKRSRKGAEKEPKEGAERTQVILELLEIDPVMTQIQLAKRLALSRKQVQRAIKILQEKGLLEREGSNRNGRWVVKGQ